MSNEHPDFSNVLSGGTSVAASDFPQMQAGTSQDSAVRRYTVEPGDTLSQIAKQFYGRASHWHGIYEANRDQLDSPDLIRPGQELVIPPVDGAAGDYR